MISTPGPAAICAAAMSAVALVGGTRKYLAPAWRTAEAFDCRPPIAPTLPSTSIVPVTATFLPPVRSPGASWSISVSVNASPADGPPMSFGLEVDLDVVRDGDDAGVLHLHADQHAAAAVRRGDQRDVAGHVLAVALGSRS